MNWVFYAILSAFFLSTSDVFAKKALNIFDEYVVALGRLIWAAPFILCIIPFTTLPPVTIKFWIAFLILIPVEITAIILYTRAIKISPLSITTPFLGLTPVFLIGTSYILTGDVPDKSGFIGIFLVAAGAYSLNIRQSKVGLLEPLRAIIKEKGSLLMVIVSILYSLTSVLGKIAAQNSSPAFFSLVYIAVIPVLLSPFVYLYAPRGAFKNSFRNPNFILLGFFYGLMILCHLNAIVLVQAPYMISVKRFSLIFSIIYGRLIFKEINFYERLTGGALILAGILCITIF
jgi:drug/metabolite transporter (DMT)-like permease